MVHDVLDDKLSYMPDRPRCEKYGSLVFDVKTSEKLPLSCRLAESLNSVGEARVLRSKERSDEDFRIVLASPVVDRD